MLDALERDMEMNERWYSVHEELEVDSEDTLHHCDTGHHTTSRQAFRSAYCWLPKANSHRVSDLWGHRSIDPSVVYASATYKCARILHL
jgi:hypothetical protein